MATRHWVRAGSLLPVGTAPWAVRVPTDPFLLQPRPLAAGVQPEPKLVA